MITNELTWQALQPDLSAYQALFQSANTLSPASFHELQPRLSASLSQFIHESSNTRFMFIKADETDHTLKELADVIAPLYSSSNKKINGDYKFSQQTHSFIWSNNTDGAFSAIQSIASSEWLESEQLFGSVRQFGSQIQLVPGIVHHVNGGILALSAKMLLAQPLLWLRLKQMVLQQQFEWLAHNEYSPIPVPIESMPLYLKIIIVGERLSLDEFIYSDAELFESALYGEYERSLDLNSENQLSLWIRYTIQHCVLHHLPPLTEDAWIILISQAIRHCEDQFLLPINTYWLTRILINASHYSENNQLTAHSFIKAEAQRQWQHGYLVDKNRNEILQEQVMVKTDGEVIGQINGLSVLTYPGHPDTLGEPSRITCVVHVGDGEVVDIERKAELGGNIHAKGMMIMQSYLNYELKLEQPIPFSASIVFEQSYSEVDGDSASLAELCVLISALSLQPIDQQIAVTGSVDQFGYVQPIGGVNEKIEGFFNICAKRGLTKNQGVIIPSSNIRHLCLKSEIITAVKQNQFHIWPVEHVSQAIPILTKQAYYEQQIEDNSVHLLALIQERINHLNNQEKSKIPWFLKWLN